VASFQRKTLPTIREIHGNCLSLDSILIDGFLHWTRKNPFGLIIVLNAAGAAEGDLFYDDGETIDTIGPKTYYFATFRWSSAERKLTITVEQNNYAPMSNLFLDTLTIYGLDNVPATVTSGDKEFHPKTRPQTQIVEITGLRLSMSDSHTITWSETELLTISPMPILTTDPKYRVDCFPDPSN
jgi:hypothetical protein